jgi:WhiB family transcriptional regulator, redox-sensing transcriptional regulator
MRTIRITRPAWFTAAACRGTNNAAFFPAKPDAVATAAKRVCADCESRRPCLEYALANRELTGIWGGTNDDERHAMRSET